MKGWDGLLGFWLLDIPYFWYDSPEWNKCRRFYLIDPSSVSVFDEKGKKYSASSPKKGLVTSLLSTECRDIAGYFSVFPLDLNSPNPSLSFPGSLGPLQLRMNGKIYKKLYHKRFTKNVKVILPDKTMVNFSLLERNIDKTKRKIRTSSTPKRK